MLGATLNAINTRLDAAGVAFILDHGEAKALIVDSELAPWRGRRWRPLRQADADRVCRPDGRPAARLRGQRRRL
jgi:hypothetical protein